MSIKSYIYVIFALAILAMVGTIITQCRMIEQEKTKQVAIKNPAEKKAEVVERVITRTVTKEGKPIEVVKEVVKTVVEKAPIVPSVSSEGVATPNLYICGAYGYNFSGFEQGIYPYGIGVGYNFNRYASAGIRYDIIGAEQRIAVEVRINF